MELECFLCKRKIDVEREQPFVFECYVYCEKCLEQIERNKRSPEATTDKKESSTQKGRSPT